MDDEFDEVIAEFLVESHENLDRLDQDLLSLEDHPDDPATLASAFRTIHTIKGTCGFLGFAHLERVTHVGENLLSGLRDGRLRLDAEITTGLLQMVDAVRVMLATIEETSSDGTETYDQLVELLGQLQSAEESQTVEEAEAPEPAAAVPAPAVGELLVGAGAAEPGDVTLALAEQDLGDLRPLGEILVEHGVAEEHEIERVVATQQGSTARLAISESTIRVDVGVLDRLMTLVGELVLSRNNILQHLGGQPEPTLLAASQQLDLVTGELQECVMQTRMQPIGTVWSKFTRVVRDLSTQLGKRIRLETEGEDTELDKTVLEAIKDPLTHMVRNTVDHGIESPEARVAAGKPADGVLHLRAHHEGGQVVIEISDDGAGIDAAKVLAKAVSKGLVTEAQAASMSPRDAVHLIFAPGFSTAEAVTNVSGRGVGMDVVRTNIERIGGTVEVETEPGAGTTMRVRIPLTLAIVPALMVDCAQQRYAIPQVEVQELVRLDAEQAATAVEFVHHAPVYRLRGDLLPLVDLREQLGLPVADPDAAVTIVVVSSDGRPWGLVVDGVTTTEEIVVKPMGSLLRSVHAFSGATILGDGHIALILDIARIARAAGVAATAEVVAAEHGAVRQRHAGGTAKVLVVARGTDQVGIDLAAVERLEQFDPATIERSDHQDVIQYRGGVLPLVLLGGLGDDGPCTTVVFEREGGRVGLVVERIVDIVETELAQDGSHPGTQVVRDRVTEMLDVDAALASAAAWLDRNLVGAGR